MIPNTEFITTFLNIRDSDLEYFFVSIENGKTYYNVQLKRKNASYLCVIVDNEKRCLYDILDSRSKDYLSKFFVSKTR